MRNPSKLKLVVHCCSLIHCIQKKPVRRIGSADSKPSLESCPVVIHKLATVQAYLCLTLIWFFPCNPNEFWTTQNSGHAAYCIPSSSLFLCLRVEKLEIRLEDIHNSSRIMHRSRLHANVLWQKMSSFLRLSITKYYATSSKLLRLKMCNVLIL